MDSGFERVRTVAEDWEKKGRSQTMAQEGGQAHPRGGEPFDGHKRSLGFSQPFGEVRGCRDRWGKPVPEPSDLILGMENGPIQMDRGTGKGGPIPLGPPVDKFSLGNGKADTQAGTFSL